MRTDEELHEVLWQAMGNRAYSDNDVRSPDFRSKLDPMFRSDFVIAGTESAPKFKPKILLWGDGY